MSIVAEKRLVEKPQMRFKIPIPQPLDFKSPKENGKSLKSNYSLPRSLASNSRISR